MTTALRASAAETSGGSPMFKLTKDDLMPQVKDVISAMDFLDKAEGAQTFFI